MDSKQTMYPKANMGSKQTTGFKTPTDSKTTTDSRQITDSMLATASTSATDSKPKSVCTAAAQQPYPPVKANTHRSDYAYEMLSNIGSGQSEMTTISAYFYNSVILNSSYADIALCFHKISIVEMHHLHIFASLACQMGLDPRLWSVKNRRRYYWTPAFYNYPKHPKEIIQNAIKGEQSTIQKYARQAKIIQDENIVENLNRIILDEQLHVKLLTEMLERI